jgi:hypothetical protein
LDAFRQDARFGAKLVVVNELDVVQFELLRATIRVIPTRTIYLAMMHLDDPSL